MVDFDPTKPVRTRSGLAARIICTDAVTFDGSIVALVGYSKDSPHFGDEQIVSYYKSGEYVGRNGINHPMDLVNVPEQVVTCMTMYSHSVGCKYTSLESALRCKNDDCISIVKLTVEDGKVVSFETVWEKE